MKTPIYFFKSQVLFIVFFLLAVTVLSGSGSATLSAFADTSKPTNVLDDLQKDNEFNIGEYADNPDDYSIQIIQIAESTKGELYLYTYQPCQKTTYIIATEINMSLSETVDGTELYKLTLLNSSGVFCKYKVEGVKVSKDDARYYNITSIYREWIKGVDDETGYPFTDDFVAFEIGKLFKVVNENGVVTYYGERIETIEIINPVLGILEYSNGFKFCLEKCVSHYVAFSTDRKIDKLLEADVYCVLTDVHLSYGSSMHENISYSNDRPQTFPLKGKEKGGNSADGWRGKKYEWERIESINQFLNDEQNDFTEEALQKLEGSQWVLRFYESKIKFVPVFDTVHKYWTEVSEVTILRLKFISDGQLYNLGAVMDRLSEGDLPNLPPDNKNTDELIGFWEYLLQCLKDFFSGDANLLEKIIAVVILVIIIVLVVFFIIFAKWIYKAIFK